MSVKSLNPSHSTNAAPANAKTSIALKNNNTTSIPANPKAEDRREEVSPNLNVPTVNNNKLSPEEEHHHNLLAFTLKKIWGKDFKPKLSLLKKAITWLELNSPQNQMFLIPVLQKLITLGQIISEEEGVKGENSTGLPTKEAAKKERSELSANKDFLAALTNKAHPLHKTSLAKLKNLNKIIVS